MTTEYECKQYLGTEECLHSFSEWAAEHLNNEVYTEGMSLFVQYRNSMGVEYLMEAKPLDWVVYNPVHDTITIFDDERFKAVFKEIN